MSGTLISLQGHQYFKELKVSRNNALANYVKQINALINSEANTLIKFSYIMFIK